jgi:hypothetical protein
VRHSDGTVTAGTLIPSNNSDHLELIVLGDVVEVLSEDQNSLEIITVNATWDGASFTRYSIPMDGVNAVELPPRS